jgi:hypothetical protein
MAAMRAKPIFTVEIAIGTLLAAVAALLRN